MPTKKPKEPASKSNVPDSSSATVPDNAIPEYSDSFKVAWAAAHKELPQAQGAQKFLNKIENVQNALTPSPGQQAVANALVTPIKALVNAPQIAESIHKGVSAFMEAAPPLMEALDAVGKIHPFINVVVLAFKAVYTLEKKRRGNDKRVLALYAEMKDMMEVLLQLNGVADPQSIGPDGKTIRGRMQKLCHNVAEDIKECGNACDTYLQKKLLVKIFAGPIWEGRLVEFVDVFAKRRDEFKLALTMHITAGVDAVNLKLEAVHDVTVDLSEKMKVMLDLFKEFVTPQQRELAAAVENMGGDGVRNNKQAMEELAGVESKLTGSESRGDKGGQFNFSEWQREINSSPDKAIEQNADFFNRKFEIQRKEIEDIVHRVGDRVISAVREGPHDRIVDPDIYYIWKDMGWRGSVKARRFVMALRDYYIEKATTSSGTLTGPDSWALKYINIGNARRILEAFDDDASGFVTVNEVNNFTQSRPKGWSLPHWVAYWATGWKMTCTFYCLKIEETLDAMIRLSDEVLSENRRTIYPHINEVWKMVMVFVRSIGRDEGTEELTMCPTFVGEGPTRTRELISRFESYVNAEEKRLQRNLGVMNYRIDSPDTFRVIAGDGRIETTLFPMLYLVLKKDMEKISLARKYVLSDFELSKYRVTISSIVDTVRDRIQTLKDIFQQQDLKTEDQFKTFAEGLYNLHSGGASTRDILRNLPFAVPCNYDEIPHPDSIPLSVLDHPLGKWYKAGVANDDPPEPTPSPTESNHPVLGVYYGFIYSNGEPEEPMFKLTFSKGEGGQTFVAAGSHYRNGLHRNYELTGNWSPPLEDGKIPVELEITYATTDTNIELSGVFDPEENSLRGTVGSAWHLAREFVFKRDPEFVRFYPAPFITDAGERWKFAITSVLDRVRRQAWSSERIFKWIKDLKRFMEITVMRSRGKNMSMLVESGYRAILPGLYEAEAELCASLINTNMSKTTLFYADPCVSCDVIPAGSRIICMDCHIWKIIGFCSDPKCPDPRDWYFDKPHLPSHRTFKVSRIVFDRDIGFTETRVGSMLDSARGTISRLKEEGEPMPKCEYCEIAVSLPCWCCVECPAYPTELFICDACELKNLALGWIHTEMHTLVRVFEETEKGRSTEERLQSLENELTKMRQNLVEVRQTVVDMKQSLGTLVEKSEGMALKRGS